MITRFIVTEICEGSPTVNGVKEFQFSPASDTLTLAAGTLLTRIEDRSYQGRSVPDAMSGGTKNVLVVEGSSRIRPVVVALLNYRIPLGALDKHLEKHAIGFALSSGPAFQLTSGSSEVSKIGYFGGISFHLWNRLFLTPGVHVGQFADFPQGFTAAGQTIPPNFGALQPVKRWTARFAFGISYKTLGFGTFTSKGESTGQGQKPAPKGRGQTTQQK